MEKVLSGSWQRFRAPVGGDEATLADPLDGISFVDTRFPFPFAGCAERRRWIEEGVRMAVAGGRTGRAPVFRVSETQYQPGRDRYSTRNGWRWSSEVGTSKLEKLRFLVGVARRFFFGTDSGYSERGGPLKAAGVVWIPVNVCLSNDGAPEEQANGWAALGTPRACERRRLSDDLMQ